MMSILPLIELAINVTLTILSGQGIAPQNSAALATALEGAVAPLITSIGSGSAKMADVLAAYGAMIGVLNALKQNTSLPQATLNKIDEYITAAQNGTSGYLLGQQGYNPANLTPVEPLPDQAQG